VEALVIIGLTIRKMVVSGQDISEEKYGALILLNSVLLFMFAIDGVLNENAFELLSFIIISIFVTSITTYQFFWEPEKTEKIILLVRFASVCVFTPLNVIFTYLVYKAFGWAIYRKIGANIKLIDMYRCYQQMISLVKLDLQFGINLVLVAWMFLSDTIADYELYINIAFIVVTFVWAGLGWAAVRHEKNIPIIVYFLFSPIEPGYVIYKGITLYLDPIEFFGPVIYALGGLSILCRVLLFIWAIRCRVNFGEGLKKVFSKEEEEEKPFLGQIASRVLQDKL